MESLFLQDNKSISNNAKCIFFVYVLEICIFRFFNHMHMVYIIEYTSRTQY